MSNKPRTPALPAAPSEARNALPTSAVERLRSGLRGLSALFFRKKSAFPQTSQSAQPASPQTAPAARHVPVILNRYDAVRMTGNRHRRLMDRGSEEAEFRIYDRMYAITLGRDMHRNQARFVALEDQISSMTAGTVRCQINTPDRAWNSAAEYYFNKVFAKDCMLTIPRTHLSELCQQLVSSVIREGDALVVIDDGFARDSGKLLVYEADQLVGMAPADFDRYYPGCRQEAGVILDDVGAIVGYITSAVRIRDDMQIRPNTLSVLPIDKCMVYSTDQAILLAARYRPGQIRGVPEMLPVSICLDDADEMVKSELLTSKMGSKNYATVYESESTQQARTDSELTDAIEAQEKRGNVDPATGHLLDPDAVATEHSYAPERPHYSSIDSQDSAIVTYLEGKDRLDIQTPTRPNLHVDDFYRSRNADAAAALGLARSNAEMSVQSSYTAFRGESIMTWRKIKNRQKKLERALLDWLAEKVISRGIEIGELPAPPESARAWRTLISWGMPQMEPIDEQRAVDANATALKAGLKTYREILGSEWDEKLMELAREVELIKQYHIPVSILETVSGAPAGSDYKDNPDLPTDEE